MDKDEAQPDSQTPNPAPDPEKAQASSGGQEAAEKGSGQENKGQQGTPGKGSAEPRLSPGDTCRLLELFPWDDGFESELCQEECGSYWDFSEWEEGREQEPCPGGCGWEECGGLCQGDHYPCHECWERCPECQLSPGEGTNLQGLSEWNAYAKKELAQEEAKSQPEASEGEEGTEQEMFV